MYELIRKNNGSFSKISAQSHYMHEAAEDNEGGPLSGITGLLLIIGIVYVLEKIGQKELAEKLRKAETLATLKVAFLVASVA